MISRRLKLACVAVVLLLGGTSVRVQAKSPDPVIVKMADFQFLPAKITVKPGTIVEFDNVSSNPHMATDTAASAMGHPVAGPQLFDTGVVMPGQHHDVTLTKPGDYEYVCPLHDTLMMHMVGEIVVKGS